MISVFQTRNNDKMLLYNLGNTISLLLRNVWVKFFIALGLFFKRLHLMLLEGIKQCVKHASYTEQLENGT